MPLIQDKRIRFVACRRCGVKSPEVEVIQGEDIDGQVSLYNLPEGWIALEAELTPGRRYINGICPECNGWKYAKTTC